MARAFFCKSLIFSFNSNAMDLDSLCQLRAITPSEWSFCLTTTRAGGSASAFSRESFDRRASAYSVGEQFPRTIRALAQLRWPRDRLYGRYSLVEVKTLRMRWHSSVSST